MARVFHIFAGLMMAFFVAAALAVQPGISAESDPDSAVLLQLRPSMMVLSESDCRQLLRHTPDDSVAFQPGVDVQGQPILPADLHGQGQLLQIPDVVSYNLLTKLEPDGVLEPEGSVGRIAVDVKTGDVAVNGQHMTSPDQRALYYRCQNQAIE